ncbi:hypothetical protein AB1N83_007675 [Pleurotus pulmonarius]
MVEKNVCVESIMRHISRCGAERCCPWLDSRLLCASLRIERQLNGYFVFQNMQHGRSLNPVHHLVVSHSYAGVRTRYYTTNEGEDRFGGFENGLQAPRFMQQVSGETRVIGQD